MSLCKCCILPGPTKAPSIADDTTTKEVGESNVVLANTSVFTITNGTNTALKVFLSHGDISEPNEEVHKTTLTEFQVRTPIPIVPIIDFSTYPLKKDDLLFGYQEVIDSFAIHHGGSSCTNTVLGLESNRRLRIEMNSHDSSYEDILSDCLYLAIRALSNNANVIFLLNENLYPELVSREYEDHNYQAVGNQIKVTSIEAYYQRCFKKGTHSKVELLAFAVLINDGIFNRGNVIFYHTDQKELVSKVKIKQLFFPKFNPLIIKNFLLSTTAASAYSRRILS